MRLAEIARFCDDVDAVANFYEALLGVAPTHRGDGIAIFDANGTQVLVHRTYVPGPDDPPCEDHVGFEVDDVDSACARLVASGLVVEIAPRDWPWGRSAYLRDPGGKLIEIGEP